MLLSTLLEYYRREIPQENIHGHVFRLILDDKFKKGWKKLFPESKVTCEKIAKDPWNVLTISDMFYREKNINEEEEYVACYRAILSSLLYEEDGSASYCHRRRFSLPVRRRRIVTVQRLACRRPRIVSVQRLNDEIERLLKLAYDMVDVIEAQGRI